MKGQDTIYTLHDGIIDHLGIQNDKIILHFKNSIYTKNSQNMTVQQQCECNLVIKIESLKFGYENQFINIFAIKKGRMKELSFKKFLSLVDKNAFKIYIDFYSAFAKSLLLKGTIYPYEIEMIITDISEICITK